MIMKQNLIDWSIDEGNELKTDPSWNHHRYDNYHELIENTNQDIKQEPTRKG